MNIKNSKTYKYLKQNLSKAERHNPASQIFQICLGLTSRCNARCIMCDAWKRSSENDFALEELEKFLLNSSLPSLEHFSLQGGEPFLRSDIDKIAETMHRYHPDSCFFIVTNCIATNTIVKKIKKISEIAPTTLCISIDGANEDTHDAIRGKGVYKSLLRTIDEVTKVPQLNLIWSFTIQSLNYDQILDVYEFCKEKELSSRKKNQTISFCARPASTGAYFNNINEEPLSLKEDQIEKAVSQLEKISKDMGDNPWINYVIDYMKKGEKPVPCGAGKYSCIITADLKVYPCSHCPESWCYGNLRDYEYSLQFLLNSPKARNIAKLVDSCRKCANEIEGFSTLGSLWRRSLFRSLTEDIKTLSRKIRRIANK